MERWVGGGKSCFKDCLQQSKICRKIEMQKKKEQLEFEQIDRKYGKINTDKQKIKPENISAPELLTSNLPTSYYQSDCFNFESHFYLFNALAKP